MQGDLAAEQLICNVPDVDPARRERLIKLLDINLQWRMHQVSDGQRRRVQICMGLLKPFQVLLLDEVRRHAHTVRVCFTRVAAGQSALIRRACARTRMCCTTHCACVRARFCVQHAAMVRVRAQAARCLMRGDA